MSGHFPCQRENHPGKPHWKRLAEGLAEKEQAEFPQLAAEGSECFGIEMVEDQIADAGISLGLQKGLGKISLNPPDACGEIIGSWRQIEAGYPGHGEGAENPPGQMPLSGTQFDHFLGKASMGGKLPNDPAFIAEKGIDEHEVTPAAYRPWIRCLNRVQ
jgi:hypothetical protein